MAWSRPTPPQVPVSGYGAGSSSGTPHDDMAGRPGAIFMGKGMKMASSFGMVETDPAPGPRIGVRGRLFVGDSSGRHGWAARRYFHGKGMKMASSFGMVETDPAPGPRIGVRGRLFVGDSSGRHGWAARRYFHGKGMKMASSSWHGRDRPPPQVPVSGYGAGSSSGTPQDDMVGRPGAIFRAKTRVTLLRLWKGPMQELQTFAADSARAIYCE